MPLSELGHVLVLLVGLWLFLTNPPLALMLFFGYNVMRQHAAAQ